MAPTLRPLPNTWVDRVVAIASPAWALRRQRARIASSLLARHYEGAATGRRTQGWYRSTTDANAAVGPSLTKLRDVARDLVRNNPFAESALETIVNHTVGWGIVPTVEHQAFNAWANSTAIDADGRSDLAGLEKLVMRSVAESGEVLVRRRWRLRSDGLPLPVQLQVLEADFIDTGKDGRLSNGNRVVQGVEFDLLGRRVAYWLFTSHPGSSSASSGTLLSGSQRIPASDIQHIYRQDRPGQVRGPSWFAPVLLRFKDFDEYEDATLMKQKIAACLAVITSDVDGDATALGATDTSDPLVDSLEPGMILNVPPGRNVEVVSPPTVAEYSDYSKTSLRAIATGLGVSYEDLTGDYCIAPETRVLCADLRWVRADTLTCGTEIVAFDEHRPTGKGQRRKWRHASVVRAGRRKLARVRIVADRATVTVSAEHMFLCIGTSPTRGYGHKWVRADQLAPGHKIAFLAEPWEAGYSHVHGYLKGIADGEGVAMSGGFGKRGQQSYAVVLSAESIGVGPVVTLETTTHTVITEGLCSHNTNLPYSAARMSRLRHWSRVQDWRWRLLVPQFLNPVWKWGMEAAELAGLSVVPSTDWTAPALPMLDVDKEALAFIRKVRSGQSTFSEAIREQGYNPDVFMRELAKDFAQLDALGLVLDIDPRKMTQAGQAQGSALSAPVADPAPKAAADA